MSDCKASSQSGTRINKKVDAGTSPVPEYGDPVRYWNAPAGMLRPECSGTGLRYMMPECRCPVMPMVET